MVIHRSFADKLAGDGTVLGRRIRYVSGSEPGRWYEVVGVVADFPNRVDPDDPDAAVYHALAPGEFQSVTLLVRARNSDPVRMIPTVRQIATTVDPTLQLHNVRSLDAVLRQVQQSLRLAAVAIALLTLSVLMLSAAGIYALMAFTVARRRREIGIRAGCRSAADRRCGIRAGAASARHWRCSGHHARRSARRGDDR